ncbi:glycosyltransferase family 2 protein [uncultured Fusobacterium sp.]|uniref:glycosyltransferase family 2 protein n=1 Tax=uncultured Fusobacterium sp. TaxID=159267 RepID=UPI0015A516CC|nr:glycosyltransferase family 2 protein [uncultured Fusobacterium sp.]
MQKPLVSIITPLYNSEKFIAETIVSVLAQTYTNWEMLIVNDCSKDNGASIVEKYSKKDKRIKLFNNKKNMGVSFTRNKAINLSQGKYIAFLDSDDLWHKEKLKKQIKMMEEKNISLSYTAYTKMNEDGSLRGKIEVPEKVNYKKLLKGNIMGCLTVIARKDILKDSYFRQTKQEDYILWLELLKKVEFSYGIQESLAFYRVLENSRSSNKIDLVNFNWRIYREVEKLSLVESIYYFVIYLVKGIKRYMK